MSTPSPVPDMDRNRLPSLFEVLSRRTLAPVDLFSFYIYMRDTQRSVDYLDFWLDVSQHMSLCRHYVRELRRSVLIETPELEKAGSKRSSQILETYNSNGNGNGHGNGNGYGQTRTSDDPPGPSRANYSGKSHDQRLSAFLRDTDSKQSPNNSQNGDRSADNTPSSENPPRPSFITTQSNSPAANSNSPQHTVSRQDIRASAEKILYTYLLASAEREIIIPQGLVGAIERAITQEGRDDPEVFDAAKDYVFQAMERDAFPGFLNQKALGNLVEPDKTARLVVGMISMFAAWWTAFIMIFLNYGRATRCWLILPFTIGTYLIMSYEYMLDPILALAGLSEYTFLSFTRIKEPYVRKLLNKRAMTCLLWIALIDVAWCCLFIFVPGKRL
ncbi:Bud site selection protein, Revert to axial protein 1 [Elasticomyces elasticus]|nr:Bud site selection protein, Revert to axial protein 1 [Elasticomyces elasticus]